jgi:hypothetical protein
MGYLFYGDNTEPIQISDRLLAHLKVVITTKLRRRESFTLTCRHEAGAPAGRASLWLQESIPLRFVFDQAEAETLDPQLLREFAEQATMSGGLTVNLEEWAEDEPQTKGTLATVA